MAYALALLQAASEPDRSLFIYLGVITLATLVALGLRFFVNMKEVITAPTASLKHHGLNDNFFFSLVVVFLGGLIGAFVMMMQQPNMLAGFHQYAQGAAQALAQANPSQIYRDVAEQWALRRLDGSFGSYFIANLIFFPVVMLLFWLVIGSISYVCCRMFGGHATYGGFLGSLAYPYFFFGAASGCLLASGMINLQGYGGLASGMGTPTIDTLGIVGGVLFLYALILFLIAMVQAADLTTGQLIGALVVLLVVLAGATVPTHIYGIKPKLEAFAQQVQSIDPSKPGYTIPE